MCLYETVGQTIADKIQKGIDTEENILDATKNANSKLIDKI
jgi:hypothetical protein